MRLSRKDYILIGALLLISVIGIILCFALRSDGAEIEITVNGQTAAVLPLDDDAVFDTGHGNVIKIKGGVAFMEYADCPNRDCTAHAGISKRGEVIVCLPNKTVITVRGDAPTSDIDAIAG